MTHEHRLARLVAEHVDPDEISKTVREQKGRISP